MMDSNKNTEIIAIGSGKGGTGKTQLLVSLGFVLKFVGLRVLMIDADIGTDGLSIYLLGATSKNLVKHINDDETFKGFLESYTDNLVPDYDPRPIRRDEISKFPEFFETMKYNSEEFADNLIKYEALISDSQLLVENRFKQHSHKSESSTKASNINENRYFEIIGCLFDKIKKENFYDYVLVDTRGGYSSESAGICALADSFIIVTEPDFTSFIQTINLMEHVDSIISKVNIGRLSSLFGNAKESVLRGIVVNKSIRDSESSFRTNLSLALGIEDNIIHPLPLDEQASLAQRNHGVIYRTAPWSRYASESMSIFSDLMAKVIERWDDNVHTNWDRLSKFISSCVSEKNKETEDRIKAEEEAKLRLAEAEKRLNLLKIEAKKQVDLHEVEIKKQADISKMEAEKYLAIHQFEMKDRVYYYRRIIYSIGIILILCITSFSFMLYYKLNNRDTKLIEANNTIQLLQKDQQNLTNDFNKQKEDRELVLKYLKFIYFSESDLNLKRKYISMLVQMENGFRDFSYMELGPVNFSFVNLSGVIFENSNLTKANFRGANLQNASFDTAKISYADFTNANLVNCNFGFSTVRSAKFKNADLRGANFLVNDIFGADLRGAKFDKDTKLPFNRDEAEKEQGMVYLEDDEKQE